MQTRKISLSLSVSAQIQIADLAVLSDQAFRSVINNRPDFESEEQPLSAALAEEAARLGLDYRDIPVIAGQLSAANVEDFSEAMREMPGPVLAFCRTGTRSTTLWALDSATSADADTILHAASAAGYDLSGLRPRLMEIGAASGQD